ncbi:hypothetical protein HTZ77_00025 [Nonomuraea sp. SMC257]|uniref:Uncharacterized protein n=1 Tax=Nonomuraea montanisoli TaxID=2741721 RepID=A0A7Y6LZU5_9ACTN|nr:hypothetical protein [Nonomuraea montanisoli]NUW29823.1 hypothetical protein [Nonomuraea montanisoli]
MTNFPKWSNVRADVVAASGGEEAVTEARRHNQAYIDGYLPAEATRAEVVDRVSASRCQVSQAEHGEV